MGQGDGDTARTLILVGVILQLVEVVVLFGLGALLLIVPFLGALFLALGGIGIVWILIVYFLSYERVRAGDYEGAKVPTLVFAILSLLTGALISGILYLIAYIKLGDAGRGAYAARPAWGPVAAGPVPVAGGRVCALCGQAAGPYATFCPACGSKLG